MTHKENKKVSIVEVGPRDGLQNESGHIETATKLELIKQLAETGLTRLEVGAFVNHKLVPQMADSGEIFDELAEESGITYSALTPNLRGFEQALSHGVKEVAVFAAASEDFSQRNLNASISESMARFSEVINAARAENIAVRAYVSCALGCPFSGHVKSELVIDLAEQFASQGCYEICLADTIGVGTASSTEALLTAYKDALPIESAAVHFHDTYGQALSNSKLSLDMGVRTFDASVAGLGGCPFAPGATGNLATEDLVYMLQGAGYETGVDLTKLALAGKYISERLDRQNTSRAGSALLSKVQSS